MSYTPPLGSAVDFQFSGVDYTPPLGGEVDFSFLSAYSSTVYGQVIFASASASHGVVASVAALIATVSVSAWLPYESVVRANRLVDAVCSGVAAPFGGVATGISVTGVVSGVGVVQASASKQVLLSCTVTSSAAPLIVASGKVSFSSAITGAVVSPSRIEAIVPLYPSVIGYAQPAGIATRRIQVSGSITGRVGVSSLIHRKIPIGTSVKGSCGRIGVVAGAVELSAAVVSRKGASGQAVASVCVRGSSTGRHLQPVTASVIVAVTIRPTIVGEKIVSYDHSDVVFVCTEPTQAEVWADV